MREEHIERYLVQQVKKLGGEVRKVAWVGRKNAPDRFVMLPHSSGVWVELKRPGGCETFPRDAHERAQHREHERMRRLGQTVVVIDSKQGADSLLDAMVIHL